MSSPARALRTPSRSMTQGPSLLSSSPRWNIPETPNYSDQELDWTPNRRTQTTTSGSSTAFRRPHERRARRIATTGELDQHGRPLPSDPSKPHTLLTLEEIYTIVQNGDRSVMREYSELFITTGINSYETKAEYAWIYLRPNDLGQLPLTEERMKVFFPEWEMVLKRSQPVAVGSSSPHTRINILNPFKNEQPESLHAESYYRSVEPGDPNDLPNDTDLRKEVRELRSENWHLQREVAFMREQHRISSLELHQAHSLILAYESSALANERWPFDTALSQMDPYAPGSARSPMPQLSQEAGNLMLSSYPEAMNDPHQRALHYNEDLQQQQTERGIFDQQNEEGNPVREPEVHARIIDSLTSVSDAAKLDLHGDSHLMPQRASDVSPFVTPEFNHPSGTADPFESTPVYERSHSEEAGLSTLFHEYPPLDDQLWVDSQLFQELTSAEERSIPAHDLAHLGQYGSMSLNSCIDPALLLSSSHFGPSQELSTPVATHLSTHLSTPLTLTQEPQPPLAVTNSTPSNVAESSQTHALNWDGTWMAALNDPRLANDPIRKFYEDLDRHPPNMTKKFGNFKHQSDLPPHLQLSNPENPSPEDRVLSEADIRLLFNYGPSVRGRFAKYFKRRDGYVKHDYRHLLYDVDPVTGKFSLPTLQLWSLDPHIVPHYVNSHYPDYHLPAGFRNNRNKKVRTEEGGNEDE